MKLKVLAFALASGIVCGVAFFLTTLVVMFQHGGGHMCLMRNVCPSYMPTAGGAFLGLVYGFVYGFVVAGVFAWLYNVIGRTK